MGTTYTLAIQRDGESSIVLDVDEMSTKFDIGMYEKYPTAGRYGDISIEDLTPEELLNIGLHLIQIASYYMEGDVDRAHNVPSNLKVIHK